MAEAAMPLEDKRPDHKPLHGFGSSNALSLAKRTLAHFRSSRLTANSSRIDSVQADGLYISHVMD